MGILSLFRRRKSLVRINAVGKRLQTIREAAAADVAVVREDDKYFDPDSPGQQDDT